jgi:hypothetical protein
MAPMVVPAAPVAPVESGAPREPLVSAKSPAGQALPMLELPAVQVVAPVTVVRALTARQVPR